MLLAVAALGGCGLPPLLFPPCFLHSWEHMSIQLPDPMLISAACCHNPHQDGLLSLWKLNAEQTLSSTSCLGHGALSASGKQLLHIQSHSLLLPSRLMFCFTFFFFFFFFFFLVSRDRVSLYSPDCPGTHFVDQAGLKLRNPPASASRVLGLKACAIMPGFVSLSCPLLPSMLGCVRLDLVQVFHMLSQLFCFHMCHCTIMTGRHCFTVVTHCFWLL
jgi:hypothetical protein